MIFAITIISRTCSGLRFTTAPPFLQSRSPGPLPVIGEDNIDARISHTTPMMKVIRLRYELIDAGGHYAQEALQSRRATREIEMLRERHITHRQPSIPGRRPRIRRHVFEKDMPLALARALRCRRALMLRRHDGRRVGRPYYITMPVGTFMRRKPRPLLLNTHYRPRGLT